jgi:hypothetical protein
VSKSTSVHASLEREERSSNRDMVFSFRWRCVLTGRHSLLPLACLVSACQTSPSVTPIHPEVYDYLVQDLCVDDAGQMLAADPATCRNRRNVKLGEPLPYLLTDWDKREKRAYQAVSSFPIRGEDGLTRIMVSKTFPDNLETDFAFGFNVERGDGFDLIDINFDGFASFIRTFDGGCQDQLWAPSLTLRDPSTPSQRAGGWLLFPLSRSPGEWLEVEAVVHTTAKIQLSKVTGNTDCKSGSSLGQTYWYAPADYLFESSKALRAIKSAHFASDDLASENNALEVYYFTREYGFTRWEAWVPRGRCYKIAAEVPSGNLRPHCDPERRLPKPYAGEGVGRPELDLRARCDLMVDSNTRHPDVNRWGDQDWVRIDCRDNTRFVALERPHLMLSREMAQTNGVDDVDF